MPTRNSSVPKSIYLWIALAWTFLIALLCLISFKNLPTVKVPGADKYVHTTFHFFFTIFWYGHFRNVNPERKVLSVLGKVLGMSILYGILIEIAQELLTTTRHADIADVAANFTGASLAVLLLFIIGKYKESHSA